MSGSIGKALTEVICLGKQSETTFSPCRNILCGAAQHTVMLHVFSWTDLLCFHVVSLMYQHLSVPQFTCHFHEDDTKRLTFEENRGPALYDTFVPS
jgi:hypothetical protein